MAKKATLIKTPTGYESECIHCGTTNFSKDAESQLVCKMSVVPIYCSSD